MQQENRNLQGQEPDSIGTGQEQNRQQPATEPAQQQPVTDRPAETNQEEAGEKNTQNGNRKNESTEKNRQSGV